MTKYIRATDADTSTWFGDQQLWYDRENGRYAWFDADPNFLSDPQRVFAANGYDCISAATFGVLEETA